MKRKLTYVGEAVCEDCGTGYGDNGPNGVYQDESSNSVILCDRCAGESDDKSDLEEEEEEEEHES